jgi:hypothetical protein
MLSARSWLHRLPLAVCCRLIPVYAHLQTILLGDGEVKFVNGSTFWIAATKFVGPVFRHARQDERTLSRFLALVLSA